MVQSPPPPADGPDAAALFRYGVISSLLGRNYEHGELIAAIRGLAAQTWRHPGSDVSHRYGVSTIERWYYRFDSHGLAGLRTQQRNDRGRGIALKDDERQLLLDVRREFPRSSSALILRTLVNEGRMAEGRLSVTTLNRLYAEQGMRRKRGRAKGAEPGQRLRWQVAAPGMVWHADVCHGPTLRAPASRSR